MNAQLLSLQIRRRRSVRRRGNVLILTAFMMMTLLGFIAFAVDLGYLMVARDQLQRSADSAAIAATWELIDPNGPLLGTTSWEQSEADAAESAREFANYNRVLSSAPSLSSDDVQVGFLNNPSDPSEPLSYVASARPNAVRVRVRRTSGQNGEVPLFFARAFGLDRVALEAEATAALLSNIAGFREPSDGGNLDILPFALDQETWLAMLSGNGSDEWKWDAEQAKVVPGADGILEINLYPQGTGSPGNRGTVDIGSNNNSTADIARQILHGVTPADLAHHGGSLEFNDDGELLLNGDTGISAGIKDELASIVGSTRIIMIYAEVEGPGDNAEYTIVQFVGVRLLEVQLTGNMSGKRVIIQPANIVAKGAIAGSNAATSSFVYSPVWLVR